jgi:hypothetical protein
VVFGTGFAKDELDYGSVLRRSTFLMREIYVDNAIIEIERERSQDDFSPKSYEN